MRTSHVALALVAVLAATGMGLYVWASGVPADRHDDCPLTVFTSSAVSPPGRRYNVTHTVGEPPLVEELRYELSREAPEGSEVLHAGNFSEPGVLRFDDAPPRDGRVRVGDAFFSTEPAASNLRLYQGAQVLGGTLRCL